MVINKFLYFLHCFPSRATCPPFQILLRFLLLSFHVKPFHRTCHSTFHRSHYLNAFRSSDFVRGYFRPDQSLSSLLACPPSPPAGGGRLRILRRVAETDRGTRSHLLRKTLGAWFAPFPAPPSPRAALEWSTLNRLSFAFSPVKVGKSAIIICKMPYIIFEKVESNIIKYNKQMSIMINSIAFTLITA